MKRSTLALGFALIAAATGCKYKLGGGGSGTSSSALPSGDPGASAVSFASGAARPTGAALPIPAAAAPATFADLTQRIDPAVVFVRTLQESRNLGGRRQVIGEGLR